MGTTVSQVVDEVLTYVPLHPVDDRPHVLAEVLNDHGKPLEDALRMLPAEAQTMIGLDEIVDTQSLSDEQKYQFLVSAMLAHDPRLVIY